MNELVRNMSRAEEKDPGVVESVDIRPRNLDIRPRFHKLSLGEKKVSSAGNTQYISRHFE